MKRRAQLFTKLFAHRHCASSDFTQPGNHRKIRSKRKTELGQREQQVTARLHDTTQSIDSLREQSETTADELQDARGELESAVVVRAKPAKPYG